MCVHACVRVCACVCSLCSVCSVGLCSFGSCCVRGLAWRGSHTRTELAFTAVWCYSQPELCLRIPSNKTNRQRSDRMKGSLQSLAALLLVLSAFAEKHPRARFLGSMSSEGATAPFVSTKDNSVVQMGSFSVTPSVIEDGGDVVVSWSDMKTAVAGNDFVTVSCGPVNNATDYLDLLNVTGGATSGTINVLRSWVQMRCDYDFTYYSVADGVGRPVGKATVTLVGGKESPTQGHLAYGDQHGEMWLTFVSGSNKTPIVRIGTTKGVYDKIFSGTSHTYAASDLCQAPGNQTSQQWFRDPGMIHDVLMTGLDASTQYFYVYGHEEGISMSKERTFVTRPPEHDIESSVKFIAYADMGYQEGMTTATNALEDVFSSGFRDFLLHFGDISYARGQGWQWDSWFKVVEPLAAQIPYMISIGNHEYDHVEGGANGHDPSGVVTDGGWHPTWGNMGDDSNGECGVPMFHRFKAPSVSPYQAKTNGIFWYSFNAGPVHIIQISTEHDWTKGSKQFAFLEHDLSKVNRTVTPWVILTGHRMMYTTQMCEENDYRVSLQMRAELEDLIFEYQVNLMLVGHQHNYERSCKVYKGQCTSDGTGTIHAVVGSAGASVESCGFNSSLFGNYSVRHVDKWGYSRLAATRETLTMEFILNADQSVFDRVVVLPWGRNE